MFSPIRHWALAGEIEEVNFFIRPRVTIRTQYGEQVLVNFHLDTPSPKYFDWKDLKPRRTLVILYAENRTFMDMKSGVRQESPTSSMVFPSSFDSLSDEYQGFVTLANGAKACFYCGKFESDDHNLFKCVRCKNAFYCGRDCQRSHWRVSHKSLCRHAPMLAKIARLDFSRFDGYVNWNRDVTAAGAGGSMNSLLDQFLSSIENKDTSSSLRILCSSDSPMDTVLDANLPQSIGDTFLVKSLKEFSCAVEANSALRHHVVDLKTECGADYKSESLQHFANDMLLSSLFASFPLWQHEEGMRGISWSFESHYPLRIIERIDAFRSYVWLTKLEDKGAIDSLLIRNIFSGVSTFMSDNMKMVAEVGNMVAREHPSNVLIRVIRVTANESWSDCIRSIATEVNVPSNVYTLWIREDVPSPICGSFNPLDSEMSLVEQLLDRRDVSMTEFLLQRLGVPEANIIRREPSQTESEVQSCFSCGELKSKNEFSVTQRRRYGNDARCRECVSLSQI